MKKRKASLHFAGVYFFKILLALLSFDTVSASSSCSQLSGSQKIHVTAGETANFTWRISNNYIKLYMNYITSSNSKEYLAVKQKGDKVNFNDVINADLRGRISFQVNDTEQIATFLLRDVRKSDDLKSFQLELETKKEFHNCPMQLNVVEKPKFSEKPPQSVDVNEGGRVVLKCSATGIPTPLITWTKEDTGVQVSSASSTANLNFQVINRTDHGSYVYKAKNIAGEKSGTTFVNVRYAPSIDVSKSSTTAFSYVGNPNTVTLNCLASGNPAPTYEWVNADNQVVSKRSFLLIINPTASQLGFAYQCIASNQLGASKPHSVMVKKLDKPDKVSASVMKREARSLSIKWVLPNNKGGGELTEVFIDFGTTKSLRYPVSTNNATMSQLSPFHNYTFKIRVKNELLESDPFLLKVQTLEAAPSVPLKFRKRLLPVKKERQLAVQWAPPQFSNGVIRKYEVAYGSYLTFNIDTAMKKEVDKSAVTAELTGLKPFHRYAIQMRAVTIAPGPWTRMIEATTMHEAPSAPRNVSVDVLGAHAIRISWKSPEYIYGHISTSEAYIGSLVNGKWVEINKIYIKNPEKRSKEFGKEPGQKLEANTEHWVKMREASGMKMKWGPFSEKTYFKTPEGVPSVPQDVKITHRTPESLSLSWQMPSSINGNLKYFMVFYENATQQYKTKIDRDLTNQTFRHQLLYLKQSTKYTLMVQAFTSAGGGAQTIPLETSTRSPIVAQPRQQDDEIPAGPIIGGIFSFLVILVLLIILFLFIARKQRLQKKASNILQDQQYNGISSPEARLLTPVTDEQVPDVVTTNGNMPPPAENEIEPRLASQRTFISSRPIKLSELKEVCDRLHMNKDSGFVQEFKSVRRENEVTWEISDRAENKCKNRYANIVAYDHSRVILSYIENIPGSDYINANYMDGYIKKKKFIATQGPVAASFGDFWRMVWEQNSHIIVMVTNLIEKSRIKCQKYWPTGDAQQYGSITVTPDEEIELADYVIRQFSVVMLTGKEKHQARKVTQFQFTGWPDHGVPQYATALLHFVKRVRSTSEDYVGPIICHCSAGVGRTGTYIAMDTMLDQIQSENAVDVHGCLTHMRSQRNYMVQTEGQYAFIYDALLEFIICGDTEIHVKELSDRIKELEVMNQETNKSLLQEEFDRLSYNLEENHIYEAGLFPVNACKNRFPSILPIEATRLKLWPYPNVEGSDYINANFVDGYQQREAFILTQAPLENTVEDFWRMIWEYEIYSIVMLTSPEESDSNHCFPYWPTNSEPANVGLLLVQIAAEEERAGYVKRDFRVTNSKTGESRVVTHFMYYDWPENSSPDDQTLVIDMISQLQRTQQMTGNGSIAVHCSDGCGRSGSLCAIMFCIERLKLEGVVDVFQTVRLMRTQRPQIIRVLEHYLFCYNVVKKFVDKFSDYANFK